MCYKVDSAQNALRNYAFSEDYKIMKYSINNCSLLSDEEKNILISRHVQQRQFNEISMNMYISESHVYRLYTSGLIKYYDYYTAQEYAKKETNILLNRYLENNHERY